MPCFAFMTRLAAALAVVCALLVVGTPVWSARERGQIAAVLSSQDCAPPCWQGIRVGATTVGEAVELLEAHPWVGQVFSSEQQISWRWSGAQPALIDGARDGLIGLSRGVVQRIRVQTHIRLGDMWVLYGAPDEVSLVRTMSSRSSAFQIARYDALDAHLLNSFICPVDPPHFWHSPTLVAMGDVWTTEALNSAPFNIYHDSGWWGLLRGCRGRTGF